MSVGVADGSFAIGAKLIYIRFVALRAEQRYPSLCEICYNPTSCRKGDKHWGRIGPLFCLTTGKGDVAWVRLDDVRGHFGVSVKWNL